MTLHALSPRWNFSSNYWVQNFCSLWFPSNELSTTIYSMGYIYSYCASIISDASGLQMALLSLAFIYFAVFLVATLQVRTIILVVCKLKYFKKYIQLDFDLYFHCCIDFCCNNLKSFCTISRQSFVNGSTGREADGQSWEGSAQGHLLRPRDFDPHQLPSMDHLRWEPNDDHIFK